MHYLIIVSDESTVDAFTLSFTMILTCLSNLSNKSFGVSLSFVLFNFYFVFSMLNVFFCYIFYLIDSTKFIDNLCASQIVNFHCSFINRSFINAVTIRLEPLLGHLIYLCFFRYVLFFKVCIDFILIVT